MYLTSYLACDVGENSDVFTGSIRRCLEVIQLDIIIMIMCEGNIESIEEYSHKVMFDLR